MRPRLFALVVAVALFGAAVYWFRPAPPSPASSHNRSPVATPLVIGLAAPTSTSLTAPNAAVPVARQEATPRPLSPLAPGSWRVLEQRDDQTITLALIEHGGPHRWIRMEAEVERDPFDQTEKVVRLETFAADRLAVHTSPDASPATIESLAASMGARSVPGSLPGEWEFVWQAVELDSLSEKLTLILAQRNLVLYAAPVSVEMAGLALDRTK